MKVFSIAAILLGLSEARPYIRNHAEKKQVCCERRWTVIAASSNAARFTGAYREAREFARMCFVRS